MVAVNRNFARSSPPPPLTLTFIPLEKNTMRPVCVFAASKTEGQLTLRRWGGTYDESHPKANPSQRESGRLRVAGDEQPIPKTSDK
jgi:hypothetical protein